MASGDGNSWVFCRCGARHWGRYGAAGLVLLHPAGPSVLLQLRAGWTHEGGRWGMVGGALDSHEDAETAALREAEEEAAIDPAAVRVIGSQVGVDHGDWSYTYVLGTVAGELAPRVLTAESDEVRWVPVADVPTLPLHRGLAGTWPGLADGIAAALSTPGPRPDPTP